MNENMKNEKNEKIFPIIGEKAPSFVANTTKGKVRFPEDYKGKWVVLFSHPADFTPVCTTEFVAFEKRYSKFKEVNTELIGLSIDQVFSHMKWTEWIKNNLNTTIEFPIIADDLGNIAKLYGMLHEKKGNNTVRAVFVIDPESTIRLILYYPQEVGRNVDEILRSIKALQTTDKYGVATPHNWPNNELVENHVIIPPAMSENEIEQRTKSVENKEIECFDWWLCHKKLN